MNVKKIKYGIRALLMIKNPKPYLKDILFHQKKPATIKFRNGIILSLYYPRHINEVWLYEIYNPKGFEIKKDDLVIDIGANVGSFSIFAANKGARVFSFEPDKKNFEMIKKNIHQNNFQNKIIAINKGVTSKTERREFFFGLKKSRM
jgi:tRNA G37 N-methylase Trm5